MEILCTVSIPQVHKENWRVIKPATSQAASLPFPAQKISLIVSLELESQLRVLSEIASEQSRRPAGPLQTLHRGRHPELSRLPHSLTVSHGGHLILKCQDQLGLPREVLAAALLMLQDGSNAPGQVV